jgi:tetratricopeptide (TPR) repeat protein
MLMQPQTAQAGTRTEPVWGVMVPRALAGLVIDPVERRAVLGPGDAEPAQRRLKAQVDLAELWTRLALTQPELEAGVRPPLGYAIRPDGALQDALLTERALEALGELIAHDEGDRPTLRALRAELLAGWGELDRAADDLRHAIAELERQPDELGREGRIAAVEEQLAATLATELPKLGRKGRKQLEEAVERMSRSFANAFSVKPPELLLHEGAAPPVILHPRVREADEQVRRIGLTHLAWVEDLAHGRSTGRRSMVGAWHDAGGTTVLVAMAMPGSWRNSATTLLSDGRIISTNDGPGRFGFGAGPLLDRLIVNLEGSCRDLLDLHRARLRAVLAGSPDVSTVPILTRDGFLELEHREWALQKALRLAEGLSEGEARAVPYERPEFAALLRVAVRDRIRAALG